MKIARFLIFCLFVAINLTAQPVISDYGIRNAASNQFRPSSPFDGARSELAPGTIFVIKGTGLGPETLVVAPFPYPEQLPEREGGTEVFVRQAGGGAEVRLPLVHSWNWQVAAILPDDFPLGEAELTVRYEGLESEAAPVRVVISSPGIFTVSQTGFGRGVIQNYESPDSQPLNGLARPARPGQYIILWGTGLGRNPDPAHFTLATPCEVQVGGVSLIPDYAGPAPGHPGLDQINVRLPEDGSVETGCYVDVSLRTGSSSSQSVTAAIVEDGSACDHPWGLGVEQMAELDAGGTVATARFLVAPTNPLFEADEGDHFVAQFRRMEAWEISMRCRANQSGSSVSGGACFVSHATTLSARLEGGVGSGGPPAIPVLDPGEPLLLQGPGGQSLGLVRQDPLGYLGQYEPDNAEEGLPKGYFEGGEWFLSGPGGDDIPPFSVPFSVPPPPRAEFPAVVDSTQDLTIPWDPAISGEAPVMVILHLEGPPEPVEGYPMSERRDHYTVRCHPEPGANSVTIPATLLTETPAYEDASIAIQLENTDDYTVQFEIPGVDYASFTQATSYSESVVIQ